MTSGQSAGKSKRDRETENGGVSLLRATPSTTPTSEISPVLQETPEVYMKRWFMLALFCVYSFSNSYQWIHLNIIANVVLKFYNESLPADSFQQETAIDWLSMIYMLAYIPLIFPAAWLLDKKGLRICAILGSLLNAVGAWMKCASVVPDRFAVLMTAQTLCAIAQIYVLGIPARLAAVWFGPNEVSTATSMGVFGNQVGVAVGFLVPPLMVPNSDSLEEIGHNMSVMLYGTATFTTLVFLLILIVFRDKPPKPPSHAQLLAVQEAENERYIDSLKNLFKNKSFMLLMVSYGINTGCYYGIGTLLNAVFLSYFPGEEVKAGQIGLTIILAGVGGSILAGIWLDKTRTFKSTSLAIYIMSMVGMVAFTFTMDLGHIWIVFLTAGSLGFFMTGYLPVGFEFAAELTFPESEGTSSGLLNASAQFFGIISTIGMRAMMNKVSVLAANITVCVALLLGSIMTAVIKADYRRQKAGQDFLKKIDHIDINIPKPDEMSPEQKTNLISEVAA